MDLQKELQHIFDDTLLFLDKYENILTDKETKEITLREFNYYKDK